VLIILTLINIRSLPSMPVFSLPDTAYKKILANRRNPLRLRMAALKAMSRPPMMFLMRLERDPKTPDKLRFAIVQRRELEMLVRKATKQNDEMGTRKQAATTPANSE
jgi:hypothetical protein